MMFSRLSWLACFSHLSSYSVTANPHTSESTSTKNDCFRTDALTELLTDLFVAQKKHELSWKEAFYLHLSAFDDQPNRTLRCLLSCEVCHSLVSTLLSRITYAKDALGLVKTVKVAVLDTFDLDQNYDRLRARCDLFKLAHVLGATEHGVDPNEPAPRKRQEDPSLDGAAAVAFGREPCAHGYVLLLFACAFRIRQDIVMGSTDCPQTTDTQFMTQLSGATFLMETGMNLALRDDLGRNDSHGNGWALDRNDLFTMHESWIESMHSSLLPVGRILAGLHPAKLAHCGRGRPERVKYVDLDGLYRKLIGGTHEEDEAVPTLTLDHKHLPAHLDTCTVIARSGNAVSGHTQTLEECQFETFLRSGHIPPSQLAKEETRLAGTFHKDTKPLPSQEDAVFFGANTFLYNEDSGECLVAHCPDYNAYLVAFEGDSGYGIYSHLCGHHDPGHAAMRLAGFPLTDLGQYHQNSFRTLDWKVLPGTTVSEKSKDAAPLLSLTPQTINMHCVFLTVYPQELTTMTVLAEVIGQHCDECWFFVASEEEVPGELTVPNGHIKCRMVNLAAAQKAEGSVPESRDEVLMEPEVWTDIRATTRDQNRPKVQGRNQLKKHHSTILYLARWMRNKLEGEWDRTGNREYLRFPVDQLLTFRTRGSDSDDYFCFIESDVYFVPENAKKIIRDGKYLETAFKPHYLGQVWAHETVKTGYLIEPSQGSCLNLAGLMVYGNLLEERNSKHFRKASKNATPVEIGPDYLTSLSSDTAEVYSLEGTEFEPICTTDVAFPSKTDDSSFLDGATACLREAFYVHGGRLSLASTSDDLGRLYWTVPLNQIQNCKPPGWRGKSEREMVHSGNKIVSVRDANGKEMRNDDRIRSLKVELDLLNDFGLSGSRKSIFEDPEIKEVVIRINEETATISETSGTKVLATVPGNKYDRYTDVGNPPSPNWVDYSLSHWSHDVPLAGNSHLWASRAAIYARHEGFRTQPDFQWTSPFAVSFHGHVPASVLLDMKRRTTVNGGSPRKWNFPLEVIDKIIRKRTMSCPRIICGEAEVGVWESGKTFTERPESESDGQPLSDRPESVWINERFANSDDGSFIFQNEKGKVINALSRCWTQQQSFEERVAFAVAPDSSLFGILLVCSGVNIEDSVASLFVSRAFHCWLLAPLEVRITLAYSRNEEIRLRLNWETQMVQLSRLAQSKSSEYTNSVFRSWLTACLSLEGITRTFQTRQIVNLFYPYPFRKKIEMGA